MYVCEEEEKKGKEPGSRMLVVIEEPAKRHHHVMRMVPLQRAENKIPPAPKPLYFFSFFNNLVQSCTPLHPAD